MQEEAENGEVHDNLFNDDANLRKNCFSLILRLFCGIFKWSELMKPEQSLLLQMALASLSSNAKDVAEKMSINELATELHLKFVHMEDQLLDVEGAIYFLMLVQSMSKFQSLSESQEDEVEGEEPAVLERLCGNLLAKHWFNSNGYPEHGSSFNQFLDELVKNFVSKCDFKSLGNLIKEFLGDAETLKKKSDVMQRFPCFNRFDC